MTPQEHAEREVLQIVLAASVGDASDAQLARLNQLILADDALALYVVHLLSQEGWLSWHGSQARADKLLSELAGHAMQAVKVSPELESPRTAELITVATPPIERAASRRRWLTSAASAAVLVGVGALIGALAMRWGIHSGQNGVATLGPIPSSPYVARFVQGTACVWGPGQMPPRFQDGKIRSGESINLMEGLAEIELDLATAGNATLKIEGPARMVLTAEGTPSLTLGKFSARVNPGFGDFELETPFGQVAAMEDSSIGIAVYGTEVEVHVFRGSVVIATPWTTEGGSVERFNIHGGEALRLSVADASAMKVAHLAAEPGRFASQTTMMSDRLEIPDQYVRDVKQASPLVYWRFEATQDGAIRNEMGDRFQGVVIGNAGWSLQGGNRSIEFETGLTDQVGHAYVEASESLGQTVSDSYTMEVWVKPSHYHLGSLVSFVRNPATPNDPGLHGALVELGGPLTTPSTIEHPGRIRFLHRDPPSEDTTLGTSCFSKAPYELRRWVYLVAVKDGPEMRLYVNGKLLASADDNTKLAPDMTLLIGQLDRHRDWRRFIGQLDELAIYDRALSDSEIKQHYELIRPKKSSPGTI